MRASIYKLTCLYIIIRRFLLKMTKFYLDINIKIINWKRRKNNILNIQVKIKESNLIQWIEFFLTSYMNNMLNKHQNKRTKQYYKCLFERVRKITLKIKVAYFDLLQYKNLCDQTFVFCFSFLVYICLCQLTCLYHLICAVNRSTFDFCHSIADLSHISVRIIT